MSWTRRDFTRTILTAGAAATAISPRLLAESAWAPAPAPTPVDPMSLVDPELVPALKAWKQLVLTPELLAEARKVPLNPPLPAPAPQPIHKHIPGPPGAPDVHLVIVDPSPGEKNRPVLVHTHGGGMIGANNSLYAFIQDLAVKCRCVVVSVDYRLAPETKLDGSIADNYTALKWVYANAESLGIDRARVAVGGESAGGGHAAALAIRARDLGEVPVMFQVLLYPMLDDRTASTRQLAPTVGKFIWTAQTNVFGWTAVLGSPAGATGPLTSLVPARNPNLAGLPPAWIGAGSIDLFMDEDFDYAHRLINSGVSTQFDVYAGGYHAFDLIVPHAAISQRFTESWQSALRRAFATA